MTARLRRRYARRAARARNRRLSAEHRSRIARDAALARWYGEFTPETCPHCGGARTHHNGWRLGRQRWRCRECAVSFYEGAR
jgi:transposase-like protein